MGFRIKLKFAVRIYRENQYWARNQGIFKHIKSNRNGILNEKQEAG